jgi:RNA polymerase nonessential primary-like sigma factor
VTLLQSSPNDTLEVRSPRRESDTTGLVSTDLVRVYLNTIGKTALLTAEQEVELAKRIEAGLYAERLLCSGTTRPSPSTARPPSATCWRPTSGWSSRWPSATPATA